MKALSFDLVFYVFLAALNNGNQSIMYQQFEQLFREHYQTLCFYANIVTKDMEVAEDIVQDVFVKCWAAVKTDSLEIQQEHYLYRSVKNAALNHIKSQKVRKIYADKYGATYTEAEEISDSLIATETRERIMNAIDELPPQCRKVFMLCVLEDKSYKEAAEELSISVNTVKTQMTKAFSTLRPKLKDLTFLVFFL
ncbi:MAG: RNA polymerase sigma-70 factor [Candidatus Pedobacter colombiensis]|uniref:RNA polymerase sigma-70 factor n=1 Tax=Candidatus Pedobacter colombiensis TaxID=3121371 RepID=A0AAJ6B9A7_9SPHI|nr:RNA polymerase sigma-70 factor [Pedobacter sp.]WEK19983.1 MAG: RNA polymerase sigma-70 factor [Pedobacter sp.]